MAEDRGGQERGSIVNTVKDAITTLTGMIAPAAFISACGLLLLGLYNKYSNLTRSLRTLVNEFRSISESGDDGLSDLLLHRERQIEQQTSLLRQRLGLVLSQVNLTLAGTIAFLAASLSIGAGMIFHWNTANLVIALVVAGVVFLIAAMIAAMLEARFIWDVVNEELKRPEHGAARKDEPAAARGVVEANRI